MPKMVYLSGPELFRFESWTDWVKHAKKRFASANLSSATAICIDTQGRICTSEEHFRIAQQEKAYPIVVYRTREEGR